MDLPVGRPVNWPSPAGPCGPNAPCCGHGPPSQMGFVALRLIANSLRFFAARHAGYSPVNLPSSLGKHRFAAEHKMSPPGRNSARRTPFRREGFSLTVLVLAVGCACPCGLCTVCSGWPLWVGKIWSRSGANTLRLQFFPAQKPVFFLLNDPSAAGGAFPLWNTRVRQGLTPFVAEEPDVDRFLNPFPPGARFACWG